MDNNPLKFIVKDEFNITGRGLAIVVEFDVNGYKDLHNKDLKPLFMGKLVEYKDQLHTIIGIEIQGYEDREVDIAAFLLKPHK